MAFSETLICNLALGHIGHGTQIANLDEQSNAARRCKLVYDKCRDGVLEDIDWSFARRFVPLALSGAAPSFWCFSYAYPGDCLKVRWLYDKSYNRQKDSRVPFEPGLSSDGTAKLIWTDLEFAEARFTARVTNPQLYPSTFVDMLAMRIAAEISYPLTRDQSIQSQRMQDYMAMKSMAEKIDRNESEEINDNWEASWLGARA